VGEFEDFEDFRARSYDAEFTAAFLHVAVENHDDAEACAVEKFDTVEVEDELLNAIADSVADLLFDLAQAHAQGHASFEVDDGGGWIDAFEFHFKNHGQASPYACKDIAGLVAARVLSENGWDWGSTCSRI
jgi:hypothetical protein